MKSKDDEKIPYIAINSGRPQGYIEAHCQTFGITNFSVFENGSGIFRFQSSQIDFILDKNIPKTYISDYLDIYNIVNDKFGIEKQPSKEYTMTFIRPKGDSMIKEIVELIEEYIKSQRMPYYIDYGINFVNVNVKNVNKGTGLQMAVSNSNIRLDEIAGIGDSMGDWEFLKLCNYSACPKNASEELKTKVQYISPYEYSESAIDFINKILKMNGAKY